MATGAVLFVGDPLDEYLAEQGDSGPVDVVDSVDNAMQGAAPAVPFMQEDSSLEREELPHELLEVIERHLHSLLGQSWTEETGWGENAPTGSRSRVAPKELARSVGLFAAGAVSGASFLLLRTSLPRLTLFGASLALFYGLYRFKGTLILRLSQQHLANPDPTTPIKLYLSSFEHFDSTVSLVLSRLRRVKSIWTSVLGNERQHLGRLSTASSEICHALDESCQALASLATEIISKTSDPEAWEQLDDETARREGNPGDSLALAKHLHLLIVRSLARTLEKTPQKDEADIWLASVSTAFTNAAKVLQNSANTSTTILASSLSSSTPTSTSQPTTTQTTLPTTLQSHLNLALTMEPSPELASLLRLAASEVDSLARSSAKPIDFVPETRQEDGTEATLLSFTEEGQLDVEEAVFEYSASDNDSDPTQQAPLLSRAERIQIQKQKREQEARAKAAREQTERLLEELKTALAVKVGK